MLAEKWRASEKKLFTKIDAVGKVEGIGKEAFHKNRCSLESGGHRKRSFSQKSMPAGKWRASKKQVYEKIDACWKVEGIEKEAFHKNRCLLESGGHRKSKFMRKSMLAEKCRASEKQVYEKIDARWKVEGIGKASL